MVKFVIYPQYHIWVQSCKTYKIFSVLSDQINLNRKHFVIFATLNCPHVTKQKCHKISLNYGMAGQIFFLKNSVVNIKNKTKKTSILK